MNTKKTIKTHEQIAKGLSPFQPEKVGFESGRIMLKRINDLLDSKQYFAFETTLSTKSYKHKIIEAQNKNYKVTLLFFWLQTTELAIERVKTRVQEGGHNIDNEIIKRRYTRGIKNLFEIYLPIVDVALIYDNSFENQELIAEKSLDSEIKVLNKVKFDKFVNYGN